MSLDAWEHLDKTAKTSQIIGMRDYGKPRAGREHFMKRAAISVVGGCALAMAMIAPADAHARTIFHDDDAAHVNSGHRSGWVEDRECDTDAVWAVFRRGDRTRRIDDANGCAGGTVNGSWSFAATTFRLCEAGNGCTPWRDT